jgi:hypothetical protein
MSQILLIKKFIIKKLKYNKIICYNVYSNLIYTLNTVQLNRPHFYLFFFVSVNAKPVSVMSPTALIQH